MYVAWALLAVEVKRRLTHWAYDEFCSGTFILCCIKALWHVR